MAALIVAPDTWNDFFVATAGAAAALAGLIIVAMSVNIGTIVALPVIVSRAAATVGSLLLIVVSAGAALIPGQDIRWLGAEIMIVAVAAAALELDASRRMLYPPARDRAGPGSRPWPKVALAALQIAPFLVGAGLMLGAQTNGLYWIAGGVLAVLIGSVANAWVLLVEILR